MNKLATSLTLAVLAVVGITAQAGLCDETVSQSKQSEVTANPDGSTTQSTAEQTEVNRSEPAPQPVPAVKAKVTSKTSTKTTAFRQPKVGTTTQTNINIKTR